MPVLARLLSSLLALLLMGVLVFILVDLLPGDTCLSLMGQDARAETLQNCRHQLGLDQSNIVRFGQWLNQLARGDTGLSLSRQQPAWNVVLPRLQNTLLLATLAAVLGFSMAILGGLVAGWFRCRWIDHSLSFISLLFMAMPEFVLALLLVWLFSYWLDWLPAIAIIYEGQPIVEKIGMILLPVITLALIINAHIMRTVRASAKVVSESSFIQMARFKGINEFRVLWRHGFRSILAPCVGTLTLYLAWLLGGAVVTERIFNFPGLGSLMIAAIQDRDYPLIQLSVMTMTVLCVLCSLLGDLLGVWLNPKSDRSTL